jgi:hypothetical protein
MTFAHLAESIDGVLRRLGGTSRAWRTDGMATVVYPGSDRITAMFAQAAKHYEVEVWVCPPRRPQRKGVVESAIKYLTRSWWRTAPVASLGQAQADLDRWSVSVSDRRKRQGGTIAELAATEPLLGLPAAAFPAQLEAERVVSRTALVSFEGNRYSVAPAHIAQTVTVRARLGDLHLEIVSAAGRRIARHRRAPAGAGQVPQAPEHARLCARSDLAPRNPSTSRVFQNLPCRYPPRLVTWTRRSQTTLPQSPERHGGQRGAAAAHHRFSRGRLCKPLGATHREAPTRNAAATRKRKRR